MSCATVGAVSRLSSRVLLLAIALGSVGSACQSTGQRLVTLMPGVVNDPKNRTLRRELMQFGSKQFCAEMTKRGAPLKLRDDAPTIGRFFIDQCDYKELDNDDAFVQFAGAGYAWSQPTGRIGFRASAAITYNPDFLLDGSTMYAYFRPRSVQSSRFDAQMIERQQVTGVVGAVLGQTGQDLASRVGSQILAQELSHGFTVLRDADGNTDFGLGIVEKGQKPFHPYEIKGSDKVLLASDWAEVHEQQREFLGPLEVADDKRALYLTMNLDGVPATDVFVMRKDVGETWARDYIFRAGLTPLPGQTLMADILPTKGDWKRTIPVPKGMYYVVIDHSSAAGQVNPASGPPGLLGPSDFAAVVRYVAQVGDAP